MNALDAESNKDNWNVKQFFSANLDSIPTLEDTKDALETRELKVEDIRVRPNI